MKESRIIWGSFFVMAAVYLVTSKMGILPKINLFTVIVTVCMVSVIVDGVRRIDFAAILFPIAVLLILYDKVLGITEYTPWTVLGAALLLTIGLTLIFPGKQPIIQITHNFGEGSEEHGEYAEHEENSTAVESVDEENEDFGKNFENNFGRAIRYIRSDNFSKASLENNFGSMSVYFDGAVIQDPVAHLDVENVFGEMRLYIPRNWKVEDNISRSFGSVGYHGKSEPTSPFVLQIEGETDFGSIQIYFV